MATTYDELKIEIQNWLDNDNPNVVAAIPTFISDAEKKLSRILRTIEQECYIATLLVPKVTECSLPPGEYMLPDNLVELKAIYDDIMYLWIYYIKEIPALSNKVISGPKRTDTNWLLRKHPDLYRFQALSCAESFIKNDERIPLWKTLAIEILDEIVNSDASKRISGSRIVSRVPIDLPWHQPNTAEQYSYEQVSLWQLNDLRASQPQGAYYKRYYALADDRIKIWPIPGGG